MEYIMDFLERTKSSNPIDIMINIVMATFFSYLIYLVYIKLENTLSNRKSFGQSFLLITICTALIISLIQSSIALSLGLVGALSIVRFRTAIKEPVELTYLFFCIAIGLGFGAGERLITISCAILILVILIVRGTTKRKKIDSDYNLNIVSAKLDMSVIIGLIKPYCKELDLKRVDNSSSKINLLFRADVKSIDDLHMIITELNESDSDSQVTFLQNK